MNRILVAFGLLFASFTGSANILLTTLSPSLVVNPVPEFVDERPPITAAGVAIGLTDSTNQNLGTAATHYVNPTFNLRLDTPAEIRATPGSSNLVSLVGVRRTDQSLVSAVVTHSHSLALGDTHAAAIALARNERRGRVVWQPLIGAYYANNTAQEQTDAYLVGAAAGLDVSSNVTLAADFYLTEFDGDLTGLDGGSSAEGKFSVIYQANASVELGLGLINQAYRVDPSYMAFDAAGYFTSAAFQVGPWSALTLYESKDLKFEDLSPLTGMPMDRRRERKGIRFSRQLRSLNIGIEWQEDRFVGVDVLLPKDRTEFRLTVSMPVWAR